jgi:hypothetical protein
MPAFIPPSPGKQTIIFTCAGCGSNLSVPVEIADISGPCPMCGATVSAVAGGGRAKTSLPRVRKRASAAHRPNGAGDRSRHQLKQSQPRGRGRILADSVVDQRHLDQRETFKTLAIVGLFILAICACLGVVAFMKSWVAG